MAMDLDPYIIPKDVLSFFNFCWQYKFDWLVPITTPLPQMGHIRCGRKLHLAAERRQLKTCNQGVKKSQTS